MRCVGLTLLLAATAEAFSLQRTGIPRASASAAVDPITKAPGDPSLIMTTNVALQDKAAFVKSASAAVAAALSKPESYVAVCITDNNSDGMSFGGSTDPTALGCVCKLRCKPQIIRIVGLHRLTMLLSISLADSIGQINQENNAALTAAISELLEKHGGIPNDRIYINFFDVPRANCGWSGRTFAG